MSDPQEPLFQRVLIFITACLILPDDERECGFHEKLITIINNNCNMTSVYGVYYSLYLYTHMYIIEDGVTDISQ